MRPYSPACARRVPGRRHLSSRRTAASNGARPGRPCAGRGEGAGGRETDAAGGAGDDDDLVCRPTPRRLRLDFHARHGITPNPAMSPTFSSDKPGVLAIDDEPDLLDIVKTTLEGEGYRVFAFTEPQDGLKFYEQNWRNVAVVLLDYLIPGMTGDLVFECLQRQNPQVKVLLLTACDDHVARQMFQAGLRGYIQKPFYLADLIARVPRKLTAPDRQDYSTGMSDHSRQDAEKLVEIHKARDGWEGNLLIGYLRDNGVEASFQGDPSVNLDMAHMLKSTDEAFGVYVLEENAGQAREFVREFLTTATDPTVLEEAAAKKLRVSKDQIAQLRGAIRDEKQTFEFLQWTGMLFLGALAVLWAIWPDWLKTEAPAAVYRWSAVILLMVAALFVGGLTRRND